MPSGSGPGKLGLTTSQQMMAAVLCGAFFCYLALTAFNAFGAVPPTVPWSLPIMLICAALVTFGYARAVLKKIERRLISPDEGVRAVVLAKSMLMTGCVLAGWHLVYVLKWIASMDIPGPRERVIHGAVTLVAAIVFAVAGAVLERACLVDDHDGDGPGADGQPA